MYYIKLGRNRQNYSSRHRKQRLNKMQVNFNTATCQKMFFHELNFHNLRKKAGPCHFPLEKQIQSQ